MVLNGATPKGAAMPDYSDIQIVTVAYNSAGVIGDMLASLPAGVPVVIVDNASTDSAALSALAARYGATVVTNDTNLGFGVACNIGAAIGTSTYLLFLNPDAQLTQGGLDHLRAALQDHPEAGAASPRVLDRRGRIAFRRRSRLLPQSAHWTGPPPAADAVVPLLNGAAMFVPRAHFEGVGGFDAAIFLYHEDDDLSVRLAQHYGPLRHVHSATITHAEGSSTPRTPATAAFKAWHMAQSAIYTMRKHDRPMARARVISLAVVQLLSPLNLLSPRKRAKSAGFLKGALASAKNGDRP
jgi:N-acetylglucosaminyl-diphospho-decaprenol L-rhamnosyltransferase